MKVLERIIYTPQSCLNFIVIINVITDIQYGFRQRRSAIANCSQLGFCVINETGQTDCTCILLHCSKAFVSHRHAPSAEVKTLWN